MKNITLAILITCLLSTSIITSWGTTNESHRGNDLKIALKSNLLHDLILTPDIGVEVSFMDRYSASLEGVYAWWSRDSKHRYWRIRGAQLEIRTWLGDKFKERSMTGHHIGIYGSLHDYDFEFGGKGWQSPNTTYGLGVNYGYSLKIRPRLNLDFNIQIGYSAGTLVKYRPQCGNYVSVDRSYNRYFGLTGIGVTLVWFPGKGKKNNPDYAL